MIKPKVFISLVWDESDIPHLHDYIKMLEDGGCDVTLYNKKGLLKKDQLIALLPGYTAHVCCSDEWSAETMDALPDMKYLSRIGVGFDTVDIPAATERGIAVSTTLTASAGPVSEFAFASILAMARRLFENDNVARTPETGKSWNIRVGDSVYGKTLGIVGIGGIGKQLSVWAKGFGMNVVAYDPFPDYDFVNPNNICLVSFDELVETSDYISIHVPLMPSTLNMFNKEVFERMKPTACLVNAARGGIVNEADLYDALKNHVIKAAALDVFDHEPLQPDCPLMELDNIILSPHAAGSTKEGLDAIVGGACRNALALIQGKIPAGVRNPQVFYKK